LTKGKISQEAIDIINIVKMCREFSVMPHAGGLLDQDKLFMYVTTHVIIWEDERRQLDEAKNR
jgi:hypothetical protein